MNGWKDIKGMFQSVRIIVSPRDKVFLWSMGVLIVLGTIGYFYYGSVCDPRRAGIEEKLDYIKAEHTVARIELMKMSDSGEINLVRDTFRVGTSADIEAIRTLINKRIKGTWSRRTATWNAMMRLHLVDGRTLDMTIERIGSGTDNRKTHLYFGSRLCRDNLPDASPGLGDYLEALTQFSGEIN